MTSKRTWICKMVLVAASLSLVLTACATPTPEVVEKVVEKVVTQVVKETVKETVIVEGTPQVVEKEITKVVEKEVVVTATPAPKGDVTLVVAAANQYGETFDIFNTATTMAPHVMIYEPLVTVDYNYEFQPGLAESWEISEDGLTWTFYLQKGVTFHDGSAFNADVVKWWLEGMLTGVNSYMFESMTEATVVDDYTINLTFSAPFPNLLYNLSTSFSGIMSQEAYEKYGEEYGLKYAVGTGPFMLEEWVQNDHLTLVKNPDYNWAPKWTGHSGPAQVDKIIYRIIPEDATRAIELQAGNVHILLDAPSPRELPQYQNNPDYLYLQSSDATIQFIGMKVDHPFFADLRTRQAVGYAIDRDLIVETVYQGIGRATNTYLSVELGGDKGVSKFAPSYDLEMAKSLLAEVGWVMGDDGVLVAESVAGVEAGTKFEVSYWTYQEDEFKRLAEVTQKMLADVGIKAEIQLMDNPTYSAALKGTETELILRQYGWDNNDILEWFHHGKYLPYPNYLGVNDPEFDAALDEANFNTPTWAERDAKYVDIHKYLIETWYPWAPVRQRSDVFIARSVVKSLKPIPLRGTSATVVWTQIYVEQ
ncbi:MAG: ABC transporter substrate-binding protein [Chloroflexota bacterium]